jgi:SAM-dependent methyltransferase
MVHAEVGDARDLNLPDVSVDAVLLLGPLSHLQERSHRVQALREAGRIVRPGSRVFAAVISRWALRLEGVVAERLYASYLDVLALLHDVELTGNLPPVFPDGFGGSRTAPLSWSRRSRKLAASDMQSRLVDPGRLAGRAGRGAGPLIASCPCRK